MELRPGALLDETVLAQEFGISRTPLREVIQRLCGEGYLVMEQNRGAKVAPMDFATLRHFFQAAPMIYAAVSRLAAENSDPDAVLKLKDTQRAFRQSLSVNNPSATAMLNHRFHQQIGEMAGSLYLVPSLDRLLIDHTRISHTFYRTVSDFERDRVNTAANQHDEMIEAFEEGDPAHAVDLTLEHWALSRNSIEEFVSPDPFAFELGEEARAV